MTGRTSRALLLALAVVATAAEAQRPASPRQRFSMDAGWRFAPGDHPGAEQTGFDDRRWRSLDVPHDWSIEGTPSQDAPAGGRGGFFPTGVGWYRKAFRLPAGSAGRQAWIEFDGIYMDAEVWLNGVSLGRRPFGYIGVRYDLTPHLRSGVNVLAVRVDNSRQPNSRWYTGSGIYRHTWLTIVAPLHVAPWGTTVTTPLADSARAEVLIRTELVNDHRTARQAHVRWAIEPPAGPGEAGPVALSLVTLAPGERRVLEQRLVVPRPRRWSLTDPALYQLRTEVADGDKVVDATVTPFGIRSIAWDADRGFSLNGERVKLRGVNLHHDAGAFGAAVPEGVWERRLQALKTMGVNAIRTSHNPPAPEFMDLCDRLGFLVMAELFDEWTFGKVPEGYHRHFAAWHERDVTDYVRRDRNHPSIVLWSAGNEIGEQTAPEGVAVLRRLLDLFHREDPTRPVTTGNDNIAADGRPATEAFLSALDIVGYNYVDRWRDRRERFAADDRHAHPGWKMIGTESGTLFSSVDERYSLGDDPAVPRANYTSGMLQAERLWKWVELNDYFSGNFMWTGTDYLGEATWPFKGFASGALDITGHPKDIFTLYQSLWSPAPSLRLFPHWNWPGREGQPIPVLAYSRCPIVELFLNGRSLGEKRMEFPAQGTSGGWDTYALPRIHPTTTDLHLSWDVPYQPGELRAVGRWRDRTPGCEAVVRTAGAVAGVRLSADRARATATPGETVHVVVELVDAAGTVVPTADARVRFRLAGPARLTLDNADLQDLEPYAGDSRRTFGGRMLAVLDRLGPGEVHLTAHVDGLAPATAAVTVTAGAPRDSIPPARMR